MTDIDVFQHPKILAALKAHAAQESPRECCGLLVKLADGIQYWPCRNRSILPYQFDLEPADWAEAEDIGGIVAVTHSHINRSAAPSDADRVGCEATGLPWVIVSHPSGEVRQFAPNGYRAPLIGRQFVWGIFDCFTLVRDWYREQHDILISDFGGYDWEFWKKGQDLYLERYARAGFVSVPDDTELQTGDVLLMQIAGSHVANHAAIYVGAGMILQHLQDRLSGRVPYGGYWQKVTRLRLRHNSLVEAA